MASPWQRSSTGRPSITVAFASSPMMLGGTGRDTHTHTHTDKRGPTGTLFPMMQLSPGWMSDPDGDLRLAMEMDSQRSSSPALRPAQLPLVTTLLDNPSKQNKHATFPPSTGMANLEKSDS